MNIALWAAQILLAGLFLISGSLKISWPKKRLIDSGQTGVAPFPTPVIRLTAACELLAVAGLILPWATGVAPWLTPAAAAGLCVVMIGALSSHTMLLVRDRAAGRGNREAVNVGANIVVLAALIFVLVGRI
ncbi:MAG: DoxX family protein [Streptosporangiales bacterium]|nr:DoxX family protein [Streptosporangiales bacterium]